jgi:hypothetical protein
LNVSLNAAAGLFVPAPTAVLSILAESKHIEFDIVNRDPSIIRAEIFEQSPDSLPVVFPELETRHHFSHSQQLCVGSVGDSSTETLPQQSRLEMAMMAIAAALPDAGFFIAR